MSNFNITFAPINAKDSSHDFRSRRASKSCDACRRRKLRCEIHEGYTGGSCTRCMREGRACLFSPQKRRGPAARHSERPLPNDLLLEAQSPQAIDVSCSIQGIGAQVIGALSSDTDQQVAQTLSSQHARCEAKSNVREACIRNSSAAMDVLTLAATKDHHETEASSSNPQSVAPFSPEPSTDRVYAQDEKARHNWMRFWLIKTNILSQAEAVHFMDCYFSTLWPLKPLIPAYYAQKDHYHHLAEQEPILTATLILLASRFHSLPGQYGTIQSERIHWKVWPLVQKYLQSAMWGSTCTRTIGTIVSMLLLIEWHCKAINTPTNITDDLEISGSGTATHVCLQDIAGRKQRHDALNALERSNVVSPAYRSDKLCWMMLGNAIALAQEGCYFDIEDVVPESLHASHLKEWTQTMLVFLHLTDEQLATRLGLEPLLPEKQKRFVHEHLYNVFPAVLIQSELWERQLILTNYLEDSRELLRNIRRGGPDFGLSASHLSALANIRCGLKKWSMWKGSPNEGVTVTLSEICLRLDYLYARMFIFASPLHRLLDCEKSETAPGNDMPLSALISFANESAEASYELLELVIKDLHSSRRLKYLPVRFWSSIVAASLQLIKVAMSHTKLLNVSSESNTALLREVAPALIKASPDDVHIGRRFSHILTVVLNATLGLHDGFPNDEQPTENQDTSGFPSVFPASTQNVHGNESLEDTGMDFAELVGFDTGGLFGCDFIASVDSYL